MSMPIKPILINGDALYYQELEKGEVVEITARESLLIDKKEAIADENGLYSKKLGSLIDIDEDIKDCSCKCQNLTGNFYEGKICPLCNTPVEKIAFPNLEKHGWINLENFKVITPEGYNLITSIISEMNLAKIISVDYGKSITLNGKFIKNFDANAAKKNSKSSKYESIGLQQFYERFEEIIMFFAKSKNDPLKIKDAEQLIKWKNRLFTSKIIVYSTYLRSIIKSAKQNKTDYDPINRCYQTIATNADMIRTLKGTQADDTLPAVLYEIQTALIELGNIIIKNKVTGKKRLVRGKILGSKTNFSFRSVIAPLLDLRYTSLNDLVISYKAFLEVFYLEIVNVLIHGRKGCAAKFLRMTPFEIKDYVTRAQYSTEIDEDLYTVIKTLINEHKQGLWVLINRSPVLNIGSTVYLRIRDVIKNAECYAMYLNPNILDSMNGRDLCV